MRSPPHSEGMKTVFWVWGTIYSTGSVWVSVSRVPVGSGQSMRPQWVRVRVIKIGSDKIISPSLLSFSRCQEHPHSIPQQPQNPCIHSTTTLSILQADFVISVHYLYCTACTLAAEGSTRITCSSALFAKIWKKCRSSRGSKNRLSCCRKNGLPLWLKLTSLCSNLLTL